jgi:hypothetical protein
MGLIKLLTNLNSFYQNNPYSQRYNGGSQYATPPYAIAKGSFDQKSLEYGNDQQGGGSSNQPYIVTPIPDGYAPTSPDFLLRNGYLNPVSSLNDVSRLTKWFTDTKTPNGILFTAKQLLLERQNVKIPGGFNRIYNPAGTIAQAGGLSSGLHLNKQGLNFSQRSYPSGENGYYKNNLPDFTSPETSGSERLKFLYEIKQLNSSLTSEETKRNTYDISSNPLNILSYSGGPNSVLGIGNTNIKFTGTGKRERTNNSQVLSDAQTIIENFGNNAFSLSTPPIQGNGSTTLLALNNVYNPRMSNEGGGISGDFNREKTYSTGNTTYKLDRNRYINSTSFSDITTDLQNYQLTKTTEELNDNSYTGDNNPLDNDLIKFYFEIINNDTTDSLQNWFLFFRAYINNIGDNFKADWQSYKYVGNAETFYKYSGFSRDVSLSFTIYAHSRAEMNSIYEKLNNLVGTTTPNYSNAGLMRGNLIGLTIGDYLDGVPGIIQNIGFKPNFETGWDINRTVEGKYLPPEDNDFVGQLPRSIDVDLSFTPIQTFTPSIGKVFIGNANNKKIYLNGNTKIGNFYNL